MDEQQVRKIIREELRSLITEERYTFQKHLQLFNGRNIQTGRTTGTKIGTATDQKIGFFNTTPIIQQGAITKPTGGTTVDAESRTAIGLIVDLLKAFGLSA